MANESDENLAKKLQAEFDAEDAVYQEQLMMDARLAAKVSKAHEISDSDSDATVEPPDYNDSLDGSQDLFDTSLESPSSPGSSSLNRSKQSSVSSPSVSSKPKPVALSKKASKAHELSDSDDDAQHATAVSKLKTYSGYRNNNSLSSKPPSKKHSESHGQRQSSEYKLSPKLSDSKKAKSSSECKLSARNSGSHSDLTAKCSSSPLKSQKCSSSPLKAQKCSSSPLKSQKCSSSPLKAQKCSSSPLKEQKCSSSPLKAQKCSSSPVKIADSPEKDKLAASSGSSAKPVCKYGDRCYRTNPDHFQEFHHGDEKKGKRKPIQVPEQDTDVAKKKSKMEERAGPSQARQNEERKEQTGYFAKTVADVFAEFQPLSLFLTKVHGIDDKFNSTGAVSIKDILSPLMGNLQASCQFNFMIDIPWLVRQYPKQFRDKPLLLVHGEQGRSETDLKADGVPYPNISFCKAKLEIMYGTHHTKMMFLLYDCGMRVVIHTANLVSNDWDQKTQGVWISPLFRKLSERAGGSPGGAVKGDSPTRFKADLLAYLAAYRAVPLTAWEKHIQQHDMSSANVYIIGSVPGRHSGTQKSQWGHLKLRKVLQETGPEKTDAGTWPVIGQFSSIGSLGATPDQWLCDEWLTSLSQCHGMMATPLHHSKLQLVYPSKENVRLCLEGYAGGGCLPYSIKTARKQIYLNNFVRKWGSEGRGRTLAIPHIKTYTRVSPDYAQAAWFLVTSANLSKAAWGALEKQKTQLMIRSYEIGVLFLPKHFGVSGGFPVARTSHEVVRNKDVMLPFPYDLPPPTYQKGDRIWMWDVPCVDLPDTHGKKYCPRL